MGVHLQASLMLSSIVLVSGCAGLPPSDIKTASISDVLNAVKSELNAYLARPPSRKPPHGVCYPENSTFELNAIPTKAAVTLKTVALQKNEASAGVTAPLGVIKLDPAFSGSFS